MSAKMARGLALAFAALATLACGGDAATIADDPLARPAFAGEGLVHVAVEIPAGTNEKWEFDKDSGQLGIEEIDGAPRVVDYLGYPGNYGLVPRTLLRAATGGDGDPLDALVLGPAVPSGTVVVARPIAVLRLVDSGETDDKIICVPQEGPFASITSLAGLQTDYPGVTEIIETWFVNYKGPGRIETAGYDDEHAALAMVRAALTGESRE